MNPIKILFFLLVGFSFSINKIGEYYTDQTLTYKILSSNYVEYDNFTAFWPAECKRDCQCALNRTSGIITFIPQQMTLQGNSLICYLEPSRLMSCGFDPTQVTSGDIPYGKSSLVCAFGKKPQRDQSLDTYGSYLGGVGQCGEKCSPCNFSNPVDLTNKYCMNCSEGYTPSGYLGDDCASKKVLRETECKSTNETLDNTWNCEDLTDPTNSNCSKSIVWMRGTCLSSSSSSLSSSSFGSSALQSSGGASSAQSSGGASSAQSSSSACFGMNCPSSSSIAPNSFDDSRIVKELQTSNQHLDKIEKSNQGILDKIAEFLGFSSSSSSLGTSNGGSSSSYGEGSGDYKWSFASNAGGIEEIQSGSESFGKSEEIGSSGGGGSMPEQSSVTIYGKTFYLGLGSNSIFSFNGKNIFQWLGILILALVPVMSFIGFRHGLRAGGS